MAGDVPSIQLRTAMKEDEHFLLNVRNEPEIVALGSSRRFVDADEHAAWFRNSLRRRDRVLLLVEIEDHAGPIGYVRLDRRSETDAEISVVILQPWRGRSIGTQVIRKAVEHAFKSWSALVRVLAYVRRENEASKRAFQKAGFEPADGDLAPRDGHVLLGCRSHMTG